MVNILHENEMIDIYDENMNHIGMAHKKEVHTKPHWHKNVHVYVLNDRGVLLQQRANKGQFPFHWDTAVVGHPTAGDTMNEAAQ